MDAPQPTTITELAYRVFPSFALLAGMKLQLFTKLSPAGLSLQALGSVVGTDPDKLQPVIDLLVAAGLLHRQGEHIRNSDEAEAFLVAGKPDYRGNLAGFYERLWGVALKTTETLQAGTPAAKVDFAAFDQERLMAFFRRQYPSSLIAGAELARQLDFSRYAHLADIGGGTGGTSIGLCTAVKTLRSTVYELGSVRPVTALFVAESGLADRIDACDMDDLPARAGTHDVALLRSVLQVLDADTAQAVLHDAARLLKPGGHLYIVGAVLDDDRRGPAPSLARGLVFLNVYDHGAARTEATHRQWLSAAGFEDVHVQRACMRDGTSLIRARRQR